MIRVEDLNYTVGGFSLRDVALDVEAGEYCVMLGKTGSGKTLLLECLAGLRRVASGRISIDHRRVEDAEPRLRGVGYVPQDYALFSTRSVRENIRFGLRLRDIPRREQDEAVSDLAQMLGIDHLLERSIDGLSGGERQRVALARALAIRPRVLLLDEPVSAVDEQTRDAILADLKAIQRQMHTTTLHVCHNTREMQIVADKVAVLHEGRILQVGTPERLRRQPADANVARLLRLGTILQGVAATDGPDPSIDFGDFAVSANTNAAGEVAALIRAGMVDLVPDYSPQAIAATVQAVWSEPASVGLEVSTGQHLLRVEVPRPEARQFDLRHGARIAVAIPSEAVYVFAES